MISPCQRRLQSSAFSLAFCPHASLHTYIMDVIIIPACRHVAPASLLPPSKEAGTAGTQPDYPINLLWEGGRAAKERGGGIRKRAWNREEGKESMAGGGWRMAKKTWEELKQEKNGAGWVNFMKKKKKKDGDKERFDREGRFHADVWHKKNGKWAPGNVVSSSDEKNHTKSHTESRQRLGYQRLFTERSSSHRATCYCGRA